MADAKTTALTEATSWTSGDFLYLVRDPAGTPVSRKITVDNILQNLVCAANTSLLKSTTGYSLTGSNASSMIDLAGTLNTTGSPAIIKIAMSNTASGATTKFLSCLAGASGTTEVLSVDKAGNIVCDGIDLPLAGASRTASYSRYGIYLGNGQNINFYTSTNPTGAANGVLTLEAANTLALRNAANAQALNIYNTYTSGSVYERGFMRWVSNVLEIGTEHTGASARNVVIKTNNTTRLTIDTTGVVNCASGLGFSGVLGGDGTSTGSAVFMNTTLTRFRSDAAVGWNSVASQSTGGIDTGLKRTIAGVVGITNGSTGGGAIGMQEQTAPAAPAADGVYIYAQDNGAGKTQLMALFATGAAQQIAIEP